MLTLIHTTTFTTLIPTPVHTPHSKALTHPHPLTPTQTHHHTLAHFCTRTHFFLHTPTYSLKDREKAHTLITLPLTNTPTQPHTHTNALTHTHLW